MSVFEIPHAPEAERALITCAMRDRDEFYSVHVPAEAFHQPRHQAIWSEIALLYVKRPKVECSLLLAGLRERGSITDEVDQQYVAQLFKLVATDAPGYAKIVIDKWWLRRATDKCRELLAKLEKKGVERETAQSELESYFSELIRDDQHQSGGSLEELLPEYLEELSTRAERLKKDGILFGLAKLDKHLGIQQPSELVTIGSNSGVGKSLLALQGAVYNSIHRGMPVGYVSIEMNMSQYFDRLFSHVGKVNMDGFRSAQFTEQEYKQIHGTFAKLKNAPFHFFKMGRDLDKIKSLARRLKAQSDIKLLAIDYLQLIRTKTRANRQEELDQIVNDLKELAMELGIVIWCPVQLNQQGETRGAMDILMASDAFIRLMIKDGARDDGILQIEKSRQGRSGLEMAIVRKGWYMTIEEKI